MTARRPLAAATLGLALATALTGAACSNGGETGTGGAVGTETTLPPGTTTTTARPGPIADQTPPKSTFGLAWDEGKLWIADYEGGQALAVDPNSGEILVRWKGDDGVTKGIDDIVVGPDGSLYWTGFDDGSVDRMYQGNFVPVAGLEPGMNGLALAPDGKLYASRADEGTKVGGDGLWEIDPKGERQPRLVTTEIGNVNSFDIGKDGMIYGPRKGKGQADGTLVRIDPRDGKATELAAGFHSPVAVKLSRDGKEAYVLSSTPPSVQVVDLGTRQVRDYAKPETMFVNGLAVAPDGTLYVSALDEPVISIVEPGGRTRTIGIGKASATEAGR